MGFYGVLRCEIRKRSLIYHYAKNLQFEKANSNTLTYNTDQPLKEIAEGKVQNSSRTPEQLVEKKKSLGDWKNLIKPPNEEEEHWVPDEAVNKCKSRGSYFNAFVRKHHCRNCGEIFCDKCTQGRTPLSLDEDLTHVRVCDRCMGEISQRLDNAREAPRIKSCVP